MNHHHNAFFYVTPPKLIDSNSVTSADVLPGRGGETNHHLGNMEFRNFVDQLRPDYQTAETEEERNRLAREVMRMVQQKRGRFLQLDQSSNLLYVMEEEAAIKKIKQRFYDATKHGGPPTPTIATTATSMTTTKTKSTSQTQNMVSQSYDTKLPTIKLNSVQDIKPPAAHPGHNAEQSQPVNGIQPSQLLSSHVAKTVHVPQTLPPFQEMLLRNQELARRRREQMRQSENLRRLSNQQLYDLAFHPLCLPLQDLALAQLRERLRQLELQSAAQKYTEYQLSLLLQSNPSLPLRLQPEGRYSTIVPQEDLLPSVPPTAAVQSGRSTTGSLLSELMNGTATTNASIGQSTMRSETTLAQTMRTETTMGSSRHNVRVKGGSTMSQSSLSDLFSTAESFILPDFETQSAAGRMQETIDVQLEDEPFPKEIEDRSEAAVSDMEDFDMDNLSTDGKEHQTDGNENDQTFKFVDFRQKMGETLRQKVFGREGHPEQLLGNSGTGSDCMGGRLSPAALFGLNQSEHGQVFDINRVQNDALSRSRRGDDGGEGSDAGVSFKSFDRD